MDIQKELNMLKHITEVFSECKDVDGLTYVKKRLKETNKKIKSDKKFQYKDEASFLIKQIINTIDNQINDIRPECEIEIPDDKYEFSGEL